MTIETTIAHRFEPAAEANAPTLLLLHGTGGDENDLLPIGRALASRAALLSPRGQVLENGMPRFFRRLSEGVFDEDDLRKRTHELADFVTTSTQRYQLNANKIFALGFSNGANIAAALLLLRPQVLAGAILLRPMVPFVPETLPDLRDKPIFIAAGRHDSLVSIEQSEALAELLKSAGAQANLRWKNAGHRVENEEWQAARDWLSELNYEF